MSGIGPELPPHLLAKRKRAQEEEAQVAPPSSPGAKRYKSPDGPEKRQRVVGPAPPPAPLDERPSEPVEAEDSSESSDDDDFGPALPSGPVTETGEDEEAATSSRPPAAPSPPRKSQRDEWMTLPPQADDLAARMDPSKLRARGFNTGKSARGASGPVETGIWTETPEQKRKRLEDEVMGRSGPAALPGSGRGREDRSRSGSAARVDETTARRIKEHTEKTRGESLYAAHAAKQGEDAEDDPSRRAFDREKDMGHGGRVGEKQRKEMLSKAAGFSGRFAGGSYL